MSTPLNVQRDEIGTVARVFDGAADVVEDRAQSVAGCTFNAAMAGRSYGDSGTAVHGGYEKVATSLQEWEEHAHGIASSLRGAVSTYGAGERQAATDLGRQH